MTNQIIEIKCKYQELVHFSKLVPHPKNPHVHSPEQIDRLCDLIKFQGVRHPIIVSKRSGFIVVGHGRLQSMLKLGMKEIPVDYQDFENEAMEYAFIVSDNSIGKDEWASLDLNLINNEILNFDEFNIDMLGIKDFELATAEELPPGDEDEVPEQVPAVSVLGDIYELGQHRLMCGDSTSIDAVEKLMNGEKADMVFTDPPYNVGIKGKFTGTIKNDSMEQDDFITFLSAAFANLRIATTDSAPTYICYEIKNHSDFELALKNSLLEFDEVIIWNKDSASFYSKNKYNRKFEAIFFISNGIDPICTGETNVWDAPKSSSFNSFDENGKRFNQAGNYLVAHPTTKPVAIIEKAIGNHTSKVVLDLFGGSGSTLIACQKTGRRCFMMELDPHYVDVIVSRYCKYTGNNKIKRNGEEIEWQV